MKIWVIEIHHRNYDSEQIKSIEVYSIEEELCPIEFTDIQASVGVWGDEDFHKRISTVYYFKTGSRMFYMLDSILKEINDGEIVCNENTAKEFMTIRENLRFQYPEYAL